MRDNLEIIKSQPIETAPKDDFNGYKVAAIGCGMREFLGFPQDDIHGLRPIPPLNKCPKCKTEIKHWSIFAGHWCQKCQETACNANCTLPSDKQRKRQCNER